MKFLSKLTVSIFLILVILLSAVYTIFLYAVPKIFNSEDMRLKYNQALSQKLGIPTLIKDLEIKTYPNLSFNISAKGVYAQTFENEKLVKIGGLNYYSSIFKLKHGQLDADDIYVDIPLLKEYLPQKKPKRDRSFNLKYFPIINIQNAYIKLDKNSVVEAEKINSKKVKNNIETTLYAKVITPYTKSPLILGQDGKIIYNRDFSLEKFSLMLDNSKIYFSGDKNNLNIYGQNLPVNELEGSFLYFYKLKHPGKKNFIENFDNFSGTLDVDLEYSKSGLNGECIAHNLKADFWTRKITVLLPNVVFNFKGREINAVTQGTFGSEPVKTDFHLSGLATKNLQIEGNVYSDFTNNIMKKYFPEASISGKTNAKVKYTVNNGAVDVYYTLGIPVGNNLLSEYGNLDNIDKFRELTAHTYKNGEIIYLKSFNYNINGKNIINGSGEFEKQNGRYKPSYAFVKTSGKVPIAAVSSFLKNYIKNGTFDADISYEFKNKVISGGINLYDVYHSDFIFLKETNINVENNNLKMQTEGTFYNSPITASFRADNNFNSGLLIHEINIHLKKFIVQKGVIDDIPIEEIKNRKQTTRATDYNIVVQKGKLVVDEIYHRQFEVSNVVVEGNLKNNIVNFIIPRANYANGLLTAKGEYNVKNHSSNMQAFASDIDSNVAATRFFKLKDQIQGIAFATAHLITKNKLNDIKADVVFAIDDGFLPKLGSTEFIINKSKNKDNNKKKKWKFTLSKISNIDFSKKNVFYSNLYGAFQLDNDIVKNVKIFSKSDFLSMFIEGDYNIETEYGNLYLWGRHNKTEAKKVRILKIPINWIYKFVFRPEHTIDQYKEKINQIPEIKAKKTDDVSTFRVYVSGEINSENKIKVELKDLR